MSPLDRDCPDFALSLDDRLYARQRERAAQRFKVWFVLFVMALGALATLAVAARQVRSEERDVPSSARREIAMRGNMVEHIDGQVRAGHDEDLISQAAETPPDDSGKWHLTVLVTGGCQACAQLKSDLRSDAFRDWMQIEERQGTLISTPASHMHFHELRYDGAIGRDWGRRLEQFLGRKIAEFPMIVVQPPIDGSFGKHTEIAYLQSGYDGDPEKLTAAMARGVGKYIARLSDRRILARHSGHGQEEEFGATPPPFLLAPANPPASPGTWTPTTIIPPRMAATVEQIRAACQGCDAEFILTQVARQATIEEVAQAWTAELVRKQGEALRQQMEELKRKGEELARQAEELKKNQPAAVPAPAATPAPGEPPKPSGLPWGTILTTVLTTLLGGSSIAGLVGLGLSVFRRARQASGKPTFLSDQQFNELLAALKTALTPANPAA